MPLRVHSGNELHNELGPQRRLAVFAPVIAAPVVPTYAEKVLSYSPIAYWILGEAAGATAVCQVNSPAQDGAYTGVTLGQPGIGDGNTAPFFDGANDYVDIYSVALRDNISVTEFTIALWAKVNSWADGTFRRFISIRGDNWDDIIHLFTHNANNTIFMQYEANNIPVTVQSNLGGTSDWFHLAITVSALADQMKSFVNGAQTGLTQTGLGAWAGGNIDTDRSLIGARFKTANVMNGWLAHCAVWDTPLTAPQILDLATV